MDEGESATEYSLGNWLDGGFICRDRECRRRTSFRGRSFAVVPREGMFWEDIANLPLMITPHQSIVGRDTFPTLHPRSWTPNCEILWDSISLGRGRDRRMGNISFVLGISWTWGGGVHDGGMPFVLVSFPVNSHCYGDDCLGRGCFVLLLCLLLLFLAVQRGFLDLSSLTRDEVGPWQ